MRPDKIPTSQSAALGPPAADSDLRVDLTPGARPPTGGRSGGLTEERGRGAAAPAAYGADEARKGDRNGTPLPRFRAGEPLNVRRYGLNRRDLELDFQHLPAPQLVTEILAGCAVEADREQIWDLEVGRRLAALIRACLGEGQTALDFSLTCRSPECARRMDLDLSLAELAEIEQSAYAAPQVNVKAVAPLRRPTGRDQLAWQRSAASGSPLTVEQIVRGLMVEPSDLWPGQTLSPEMLRACEAALEAADPLVNFVLQVNCPYCGIGGDYAVDLQTVALRRAHQTQTRLLQDVHTLAGRYHWTEAEIMSLPEWRRSHYLALVRKEQGELA